MKRNALLVACCLVSTVVGFSACQPAAPDTNRDVTNNAASTNAARETVDPVAVEAELTRIEKDWAAASQRHDAEAAGKSLADDLVLVYPDGTTGTKSSELRDIAAGAMTVESWEVTDTKVTVLGPDAAFITGRGIIKNGKYKTPESKTAVNISGEYRFTDIYARRNGKWLAVASQTTKIDKPTPPTVVASPSPAASPSPSTKASPK
jgi:ketosteroid isomerase-like protein